MPEPTNPNTGLYLIAGIIAILFLAFVAVGLVSFFNDFSLELKYLNNEIRRTDHAEQQYWIRKRRRLWLSLIPFVKY